MSKRGSNLKVYLKAVDLQTSPHWRPCSGRSLRWGRKTLASWFRTRHSLRRELQTPVRRSGRNNKCLINPQPLFVYFWSFQVNIAMFTTHWCGPVYGIWIFNPCQRTKMLKNSVAKNERSIIFKRSRLGLFLLRLLLMKVNSPRDRFWRFQRWRSWSLNRRTQCCHLSSVNVMHNVRQNIFIVKAKTFFDQPVVNVIKLKLKQQE